MNCTTCKIKMTKVTRDHAYLECGLKSVVLKDMTFYVCPDCGDEEIVIPNVQQLHDLIARDVARQAQRLLPQEIRFLRVHLGFSGADFAKAISVSPETVSRWENNRQRMDIATEKLLRVMILAQAEKFSDYGEMKTMGIEAGVKNRRRVFLPGKTEWKMAA